MKKLLGYAALAAAFVCAPAMAQTISGKYIVTLRKYCEPLIKLDSKSYSGGGNYVDSFLLGGSDVGFSMSLVSFNVVKHNVSGSGFTDEGNVISIQYTGSVTGSSGAPFQETPATVKGAYSNTDTTISLAGLTFNAFFGEIDKNGITHYIAFQTTYTNDGGQTCGQQGEAVRQ